MTKFLDGPVAGATLMLRNAPYFLRVTRHQLTGNVDALDQAIDLPMRQEDIFVYVRVAGPWWMHIRAAKGGGVYRGGEYRLLDKQPDAATLFDNTQWRRWCDVNTPQESQENRLDA